MKSLKWFVISLVKVTSCKNRYKRSREGDFELKDEEDAKNSKTRNRDIQNSARIEKELAALRAILSEPFPFDCINWKRFSLRFSFFSFCQEINLCFFPPQYFITFIKQNDLCLTFYKVPRMTYSSKRHARVCVRVTKKYNEPCTGIDSRNI